MGICCSSHHGQAEPAAAPVPAEVKMSAGEIVKLLPSLSPGLSQALLRFLQGRCFSYKDVVHLYVRGHEVEAVLEQVCEGFAAELEAAVAAVEEGSSSDVILQLSLCLLLALAPSLPNAREIKIVGDPTSQRTYGGEQALEVLCSALVSQNWSNDVRRLTIMFDKLFGTDRACEHLAHLLQSGHCKLQQLTLVRTVTGAGGMRHIARALRTNSTLTVLEICSCLEVGDGGVEQLSAMLLTNSTLEELILKRVGMTSHGLRHLCDALSTHQSLSATSSSPTGTMPNGHMGGLKKLDISWNGKIGKGGAALLGAMLSHNRCLRSLDVSECDLVDGKGHLAKGLRENSTLEQLNISDNKLGKVALGLLVRCLATNNTGLKTLEINGMKEMPAAKELGDMLAKNRCLRTLRARDCSLVGEEDGEGHLAYGLRENSTLEKLDISSNKLGKVALGLLVRCLATNNNTRLKKLHIGTREGEMPAAKELAHMVTDNQSLLELGLQDASYDAGEWATIILPALGRNKTLLSIDLEYCPGVEGQQVWAALFDLLRINTTIQEIALYGTPLQRSGEAEAVEVELRRNKLFRRALSGLPTAKPKSCRIVLCGHPYAGKTSLLQTMKLLQQDAQPMRFSESQHSLSFDNNSTNLNGNERTRGIDIHLFKDDPDLRISVWDLAGHREFHALHDFMFPSGNNAATLFVLTLSPIVSPMDKLRAGEVKTMQELDQELLYWLRFITSNSKPNAAAPTVMVVITHKDILLKLTSSTHVESWMRHVQGNIVVDLAAKFIDRVKVHPQPFMVNALANQDVELHRWVKEVEESLRSTLDGLEEEPAICTQVLRAIQQDASQTRSNSPIISRSEFADICRSLTLEMTVALESEEGQSDKKAESLPAIRDKIGTVVGAYLHDAGEIIHHHKLDLIVSNPKWFCHGVLGQLIDLFPSFERPERPKNGLVSRGYLSDLLQKAVKSVPGLDPTFVTVDQLIHLMLLLDLCYEQTPGDPHTDYFLPAIFDDEGDKAADGERPLTWQLDIPVSTFVGRRLQCDDLERTFLTDGFFPRLQVVQYNHALKEKWVVNKYSSNYKLEKNLISIRENGMEIFVEFSGSSGYFVDILVKSSKSHEQTMDFLRNNIIGTIRTFCASQEGCQGVTLAEAIIRPACLRGADGGNPILCKYRRHQSILVEELREKMKQTPDYDHCWEEVEDGAGGLVLHAGQDSGTVLLDGPKDVPPSLRDQGPEMTPERQREQGLSKKMNKLLHRNYKGHRVKETCYPNTNRKHGKTRGLALIVSMETKRPGAGVDRGKLEILARVCGFREVVLVDPVACNITRIINSLLEEVLEEDECFFGSINAHGGTQDGEPYILDRDGAMIMVMRDIVKPFRRSKHLQGKPKVIFINCCRGRMLYVNSQTMDVNCHSAEADADAQQGTGSPRPHVTNLSDCLLVFSTSEDCPSCRDPLSGSSFVKHLVDTVVEKRQNMDVLNMMTVVNERVNEEQNLMVDPDTKTQVIVGQCCEYRASLRKKLYWD